MCGHEHMVVKNEYQEGEKFIRLGTLGDDATGDIKLDYDTQSIPGILFYSDLAYNPESFYIPSDGDFIYTCIDGRLGDENLVGPNSAGGSISLWAAYNLIGNDVSPDKFFKKLSQAGLPLGGHVDEHQHGTGCGANDRAPEIFGKIAEEKAQDFIVSRLNDGQPLSTDFVDAAKKLSTSSQGGESSRLSAIADNGGQMPELKGNHTEIMVVLNNREWTTFHREYLTMAGGLVSDNNKANRRLYNYCTRNKDGSPGEVLVSAFNIDVWAFQPSAEKVLEVFGENTPQNVQKFVEALTVYNIATALTLGHSSLPVVTLPAKDYQQAA
jgi:hypothetical protein